jgi:RNA polymerase sigma-70 factor, ECF subfamily
MPHLDTHTLSDAYRRYFPLLRGKCRRMLRTNAEAEEVAQDAFVRLIDWSQKGKGELPDSKQVTAWLYKTSTRLAIDRLRTRRGDTVGTDDEAHVLAIPSAEPMLLARKTLERLAQSRRSCASRMPA